MARYAAAAVTAAALAWAGLALHADPNRDGRAASFTLASGAAFGFILQRSRFGFASAFRDLLLRRDRRGALGILAALAAGSAGYMAIFPARIPDASAGYLPETAHIAPASWHLLVGGAAFGLGMTLAGGCINGALCSLGDGSLAAPVALLGTGVGYWAGFASWNFLYATTLATAPVVWLPKTLGYAGALGLQLTALALLALLIVRLIPAPPASPPAPPAGDFRTALRRVFVDGWPTWMGGLAIGVLGAFTFLRTSPLGVTAEIGRLSRKVGTALGVVPPRLEGLDRMSGCRALASDAVLTENGIFILALVAGSLCAALLAGEFRFRGGTLRSLLRAFLGGILLGFGAMISLGCTVGTLLSGVMAFSLSGWLFAAGLLGGARAGLFAMKER